MKPERRRTLLTNLLKNVVPLVAALGSVLGHTSSRAEEPQMALYMMNADGSDLKKLIQVADKRWHGAPAWSKDGKLIAFHAHAAEPTKPDGHVYVVRADGSDLTDLGSGTFASWSPDGKQVVFGIPEKDPDKAQAGVWIMNADGRGRQWMFQGTGPSYSPDGGKILYVSHHEGNQSIYVYDLIEGNPKKILQEVYQRRPGNAHWSADGKRVGFIDERNGREELIIIDAAGSEKSQKVRQTGPFRGNIGWKPGEKILISLKIDGTSNDRLHWLNPDDDGFPQLLPNQSEGTHNFDGAWSPDGSKIVFSSDRGT